MKNFNAIVDFQFALINFIYTYLYEDYFTSTMYVKYFMMFGFRIPWNNDFWACS